MAFARAIVIEPECILFDEPLSALDALLRVEMRTELKEVLIKSGMQIAQTDFSLNCMKTTQEYLMYFKHDKYLWTFLSADRVQVGTDIPIYINQSDMITF